MPTFTTGSVNLNYGDHSHNDSFDILLDAHADTSAGRVKNFISCDRRVEDPAAGDALPLGDVETANTGLTIIKNLNDYGDLHVDINYASSFTADLIIPAGGVNLIHPNASASVPTVKCPLPSETSIGITSATSAGLVTFDGDREIGTTYIASTANPGGGANFIIKIATVRTGTLYELDGVTIKDMSATWGATTVVSLDYFVDYRYILTEA